VRLEVGAGAAGAVIESELLPGGPLLRAASLPRLASAAARGLAVRQLRAGAPEFRLDGWAADLFDLLAIARALLAVPSC
jgi:hypothetical protein